MATKKIKSNATQGIASNTNAVFFGASSSPPTSDETRDELIIFWDAFSPLSAAGIRMAYDIDKSLEDIGISEDDAVSFINKYNSIILRGPGKGPLVRTAEARDGAAGPMKDVVTQVASRAQP